ncbi:DUF3267 domain-containing protein [Bacillus spongiae]|uniref:DUF3267 domain-containing protein n=1 Tax=Bacillus spongiae TaxID=2683610 RepID=A0ABU8HB85_9BACI
MHCWKSINLEKQLGFNRLFLISIISGTAIFSLFYVPLNLLFSHTLDDQYFLLFISSMLILYPLHKVFHLIPLLPVIKNVRLTIVWQFSFLPIISIKVKEPIRKYIYLSSIFCPIILLNALLLVGCWQLPNYIHYFTMLIAYHGAICTIDVIYAKYLLFCPKDAMIEESDDGFEVLVLD